MKLEIERKFLVAGQGWKTQAPLRIIQGYLSRDKERTVRIRIQNEEAILTIKGPTHGTARQEFEYPVPLEEGRALLKLCEPPCIEKKRHRISYNGGHWEVDEFLGEHTGLVIAEIELDRPEQTVDKPPWVGQEVTGDPRYYNASLMQTPR